MASGRTVVLGGVVVGLGAAASLIYKPIERTINWTAKQTLPESWAKKVESFSYWIDKAVTVTATLCAVEYLVGQLDSSVVVGGGHGGPPSDEVSLSGTDHGAE